MGMAAILVMWLKPFEQTFVLLFHGGSIWNLTVIGPLVSEEMFEDGRRRTADDGRRTTETYLSYKLANEPTAQVS